MNPKKESQEQIEKKIRILETIIEIFTLRSNDNHNLGIQFLIITVSFFIVSLLIEIKTDYNILIILGSVSLMLSIIAGYRSYKITKKLVNLCNKKLDLMDILTN